jgi:NhaP-type Na+/H+ or K+/H+ antiporter
MSPAILTRVTTFFARIDPLSAKVGVNPDLYYNVFGESLLNDGVAVVLYNMMIAFAGKQSVRSRSL